MSEKWPREKLAVLIILAVCLLTPAGGQEDVLSKTFSFRNGNIKTGAALNVISRQTGYYFTYDSKIINTESRTSLEADKLPLSEILRSVLLNDSIQFSVIGKHIIISRVESSPSYVTDDPPLPNQSYVITGRVTDSYTGEPLPFATVAVKNRPKGTVANSNGFFTMNLGGPYLHDTISISYIGYINRSIPVRHAIGNEFTINLFRDYIPIPEIIIRTQVPVDIIRRSISAIPANYGTTPASMWSFYREGIKRGKELQLYSEAVLQIYKASYTNARFRDQVKVVRSRKSENISLTDTLLLRLQAGLNSSLMLDGIGTRYDFMEEENFSSYRYSMTDIVTIDGAAAFVIEFEQEEYVTTPLFRGAIMINTTDYALMQTEFELNPAYIDKSDEIFVTSSARGYTIRPVSVRYRVSYSKKGDRYFLNHVRGDLRFSVRKKRRLFSTPYDVFFELAVTSANTTNVTRFDRDETIPLQSVFSRTVRGYDAGFWEGFDFLSPEDDLIKSLETISMRLSRYLGEER